MDKFILQDVPPEQRPQYLRENAHRVDPKHTYTRELEEGELQDRQQRLSQNLIKMDKADQVLNEAKLEHKTIVNPLKEQNKTALQEIRTRSEEITGEVYLIKDEHNDRMGIYSPMGVLLSERSLLPEERQYSITETIRKVQ